MKLDFVNAIDPRQKFGNQTVLYQNPAIAVANGYTPQDGDLAYDSTLLELPQPFIYNSTVGQWFSSPMIMTFPTVRISATAFFKNPIRRWFHNPTRNYTRVINMKTIMENTGATHNSSNYYKVEIWQLRNTGAVEKVWTSPTSSDGMLGNLFRQIDLSPDVYIDSNGLGFGIRFEKVGSPAAMDVQSAIVFQQVHEFTAP